MSETKINPSLGRMATPHTIGVLGRKSLCDVAPSGTN